MALMGYYGSAPSAKPRQFHAQYLAFDTHNEGCISSATLLRRPWHCRKTTGESHGLDYLSSISARGSCAGAA